MRIRGPDPAPLPHVEHETDVRRAQGVEERVDGEAVYADRGDGWAGHRADVGTVAAPRVAARPSRGQVRGGEHEEPGGRIEIARLSRRDRVAVGDEDLGASRVVGVQAGGVRLVECPRRRQVRHVREGTARVGLFREAEHEDAPTETTAAVLQIARARLVADLAHLRRPRDRRDWHGASRRRSTTGSRHSGPTSPASASTISTRSMPAASKRSSVPPRSAKVCVASIAARDVGRRRLDPVRLAHEQPPAAARPIAASGAAHPRVRRRSRSRRCSSRRRTTTAGRRSSRRHRRRSAPGPRHRAPRARAIDASMYGRYTSTPTPLMPCRAAYWHSISPLPLARSSWRIPGPSEQISPSSSSCAARQRVEDPMSRFGDLVIPVDADHSAAFARRQVRGATSVRVARRDVENPPSAPTSRTRGPDRGRHEEERNP